VDEFEGREKRIRDRAGERDRPTVIGGSTRHSRGGGGRGGYGGRGNGGRDNGGRNGHHNGRRHLEIENRSRRASKLYCLSELNT
jgi:hypothetical protein